MTRILKFLLPVFSLYVLSGCAALAGLMPGSSSSGTSASAAPAASAATASVPSILDQVEPSTKLAMFSPAALLDGSTSLDATIVESQCRFRTADPPFLVPTTIANKTWTFNGGVNPGNADHPLGRDAEALEYRSWFGFGSSKQQLNTWPVSMVTLSEMPKAHLDDRLTMLSDHTYPGEQDADRRAGRRLHQRIAQDSGPRANPGRVVRPRQMPNPVIQTPRAP